MPLLAKLSRSEDISSDYLSHLPKVISDPKPQLCIHFATLHIERNLTSGVPGTRAEDQTQHHEYLQCLVMIDLVSI